MVQYEIDNDIFKNIAESRASGYIHLLLIHRVLPMVVLIMEGNIEKIYLVISYIIKSIY